METPAPEETARRVRAAIAYAGKNRREVAEAAHVSLATLDRISGKPKRGADWRDLGRIAKACGLPAEWFSADLRRLDEIVPPGMPKLVRHDRSTRTGPATARALKDRLRREGRPDKDQEEPGEQTG